ncbi:MAG: mechanosensitive ion channel family protein [Lachnospiraceae bacterium]|nr:mechanosensitive ion channel family protein [Lachnospiraceae bacterium]
MNIDTTAVEQGTVSGGVISETITEISEGITEAENLEDVKNAFFADAISNYLDALPNTLLSLGVRVLLTVIVVIIGHYLIKLARKILKHSLKKANIEDYIIHFIDSVVKIILYVLLIMTVASSFGVDATSIVAVVGSMGLTIGLALQGSLSNVAGGMLILLVKPFVIGDYIIESNNKLEGWVQSITIFYTTLKTIDRKKIMIPNGELANSSITNVTTFGHRMVDLSFGISYDSDIKKAKEIVLKHLEDCPYKTQNPQIKVFVRELADSAVIIGARIMVESVSYYDTVWSLNEDIKMDFDANGISIPFPQMDVHIKEKQS